MENQYEIKLVQSPVIQHALVEIGKSVDVRLEELNVDNLIATEDTIKSLKNLRAELNKEYGDYETQRKAIGVAVNSPYKAFEDEYKTEVSSKYLKTLEILKTKIGAFEDKIKEDKKEAVKSYFVELCLSEDIDFIDFTKVGLEINLSTSQKAYKEKCNEFIARIVDDLKLIDTQAHKAEILVEYKKTLNASKSIKDIQDRKEAERQEKERLRLNEIQRRQRVLSGLSLVFKQFTQTYEFVSDENIFMDNKFLEESSKEEFADKVILIEQLIQNKKAHEAKEREEAARLAAPKQEPQLKLETVINEVAPEGIKKVFAPAQPLQAPVIEKPTEHDDPIKEASFTVTGKLSQLRALGQYMKENNLTYKNI